MSRRIIHCGRCGTAGHNVTTCASTARGPGVSRQRLWQIRRTLEGRCQQCGKPAVTAHYCEECRVKHQALNQARRRRRNADRVMRGICVMCGRRKARVGQRCNPCRETENANQRRLYRAALESQSRRAYHCTNCGGAGHQKRTCPSAARGAA